MSSRRTKTHAATTTNSAEGGAASSDRSTVYDIITERICAQLEKGTVPWLKPWKGGDLGLIDEDVIMGLGVGADEFVEVNVEVSERPTGTFQIGAGFSSVENFIAQAQGIIDAIAAGQAY